MNKKDWQHRQDFFDYISNYQYIREDGRLVLESFCVYLSHCFGFDEILELSPKPRDIYMLLVNLIREHLGNEEAKKKIQFQNISDWDPEMAYIFPERRMTCVHAGALVLVSHYWIYDIGHTLMRIPRPEKSGKYFAWVKEEWLAVYTFINGYHNEFNKFQKRFDRGNISSKGYSLFEASHIARVNSIRFDEAINLLKTRHNSYQVAMEKISKALHEGYYLEAITLEECLISNCLFNFLNALEVKLSNPSFYTLLNEILDKDASAYAFPSELLVGLDKWRKARNSAIHGFISSHNTELTLSGTSFRELSRETAMQGEGYCKSVVSWYEVECVNFIRHEFPKQQKNTTEH